MYKYFMTHLGDFQVHIGVLNRFSSFWHQFGIERTVQKGMPFTEDRVDLQAYLIHIVTSEVQLLRPLLR